MVSTLFYAVLLRVLAKLYRQYLPRRRADVFLPHQALTNQKRLGPCCLQLGDVGACIDAAFSYEESRWWNYGRKARGGGKVCDEGLEVAVVHANQLGVEL